MQALSAARREAASVRSSNDALQARQPPLPSGFLSTTGAERGAAGGGQRAQQQRRTAGAPLLHTARNEVLNTLICQMYFARSFLCLLSPRGACMGLSMHQSASCASSWAMYIALDAGGGGTIVWRRVALQ